MIALSPEVIERARAADMVGLALAGGVQLKRQGGEWVGPCPHCGGRDRFAINAAKQVFLCRICHPKGGHGAISLASFLDGGGFIETVERLSGERVRRARLVAVNSKPHEDRQHRTAARLWSQRQPITGSIAERYLRQVRGYGGSLPPTLAFLPARGEYPPAMIAAFGLVAEIDPGLLGEPQLDVADAAVHLTKLKPDGSGKADIKPNKIVIGQSLGRPIVLAPPNDLLGLAITEGIETALTAHEVTGLGAWAAYCAGQMPKLADTVGHIVEAVTIYADNDDDGKANALALAEALHARGTEVFIEGIPHERA